MKLSSLKAWYTAVAIAMTAGGCTGTGAYTYTYYDPYLYSYYYPADLSYSTYYYTDAWAYSGLYYSRVESTSQAATTPSRWTVGTALRALARRDSVCPGQVTITRKMATPVCSTSQEPVPSGATVVFKGCQLAGGGVVDGTVDVTAMASTSDETCGTSTTITLNHTSTITNLSYKGSGGSRLVIPNGTDTGTNSFTVGQMPATVSITSSGRFQFYDNNNKLLTDQNYNGTRSYKFADTQQGYTVDGTLNLQDNSATGSTSTLNATGVTRTSDCCYPTAGTLSLNQTGGAMPGQHSFTFGPTCGATTQDSGSHTLPACE